MKLLTISIIFFLTTSSYSKTFEINNFQSKKIYMSLIDFSWGHEVENCNNSKCEVEVNTGVCVIFDFGSPGKINDSICEWSYRNERPYGSAKKVSEIFNFLSTNHTDVIRNEFGSVFLTFESLKCTNLITGINKYNCTIDINDIFIKH